MVKKMSFKKVVKVLSEIYNRRQTEIYVILGEFVVQTNEFTKPYTLDIRLRNHSISISWTPEIGWSIREINESIKGNLCKLQINE